MRTLLWAVTVGCLAGCFQSHRTTEGPDGGPARDGGPVSLAPDSGPTSIHPPTGGCGSEPAVPECRRLCDEACEHFARCGGDFAACLDGCYEAYACPGETPGHDAAICGPDGWTGLGCDAVCRWVPTFGDFGRDGPSGPPRVDPPPSAGCAGRPYCDCAGDCTPLVDRTTGCICSCDDPFNCDGILCDCDCGGATYLGCAPAGACPVAEISCDPATERGALVDGCPTCRPR